MKNLPSTINLTLPLTAPTNKSTTCTGLPGANEATAALEDMTDISSGLNKYEVARLLPLLRAKGCVKAQQCRCLRATSPPAPSHAL